MKNTLWHVGESNPEAKVELAAYDYRRGLSCRVRVRCHNVARGNFNHNLMNENRGERWSRTTEGRNESQSKVTAYTTGARHSRAASSRRDAGKHSNVEMKKNVWGRAACGY